MHTNDVSILCTRLLPESIIAKALENGIRIDIVPFIKTEAVAKKAIVEEIHELANRKTAVVFTSLNAVEAVIPHLSSKPDWDIYCMGGVTKETVINFFGENVIKRTARNAVNLAEKIIAAKVQQEIIFFCSDHRLDKLPDILKTHAINFKEVIVYNTIETPHFIEKNYEGIIFFSPSAVHSFFLENTIATDVILFAIGKTTAAMIATYVSNEIVASEWPGQEQLIDQVIQYYNEVSH
jgi:uroporphyrinogen-III synthase